MMVGKSRGGVHFDAVAGNGEFGILSARAIGAGREISPDVFGVGRQRDRGGSSVDGDVPLVAGDVPVEFVEIFVEFQGLGDGVLDVDGLDGVVGVVDVDFELAVVAFARGFVAQGVAGAVGDVLDVEEKRIVHALLGDVFDGNFAIEAVPGAAEKVGGDGFGDSDGGVGEDIDLGAEIFYAEFFGSEREGEKK